MRIIKIDSCNTCFYRDHKGAFAKVSCVPVCSKANKELPYEVVLNKFQHLQAHSSGEIPDWCPLEKID